MINSRSLDDLHPKVKQMCVDFLAKCVQQGIDVIVTSTYRDSECQNSLYAQGRTKPGNIVTNAKAGQSFHNWKVAFDIVPLRDGKPVWGTSNDKDKELWCKVGKIGISLGLEWAGNWKKFQEYPHFQYTGGLSLHDFQEGKII